MITANCRGAALLASNCQANRYYELKGKHLVNAAIWNSLSHACTFCCIHSHLRTYNNEQMYTQYVFILWICGNVHFQDRCDFYSPQFIAPLDKIKLYTVRRNNKGSVWKEAQRNTNNKANLWLNSRSNSMENTTQINAISKILLPIYRNRSGMTNKWA